MFIADPGSGFFPYQIPYPGVEKAPYVGSAPLVMDLQVVTNEKGEAVGEVVTIIY